MGRVKIPALRNSMNALCTSASIGLGMVACLSVRSKNARLDAEAGLPKKKGLVKVGSRFEILNPKDLSRHLSCCASGRWKEIARHAREPIPQRS